MTVAEIIDATLAAVELRDPTVEDCAELRDLLRGQGVACSLEVYVTPTGVVVAAFPPGDTPVKRCIP